ncbi:hypothetical protein GCM10010172_18680 [Paractinoplanes ferrugineus]|uniref:Uncharacterized protein n=1 Tax=Paractinoplanes ferrugineus TaxID=113564 RepID=A0A919JCV8_9ACTN|nr:hypothetical protein [Actinoplanes ferrugineus]GIE14841.1 hypothetical protein Afe05nite_66810 [Actinoplanes ferrugineus]
MDHDLNRLATLDPAAGREPTAAQWSRARAGLERTMRTPAAVRRPVARRLATGLAVACVLAAGAAIGVPALLPDGDAAYASWTAVPRGVPGPESLAAARECARSWDDGGRGTPGEIVLAERRGVTVLLIMWLRDGPLIICSSLGTGHPAGAERLSGDRGEEPPRPANGRVTLDGGLGATGSGSRWYSQAAGRVAADVTGVDIALPDGRTVRASVRDGWWVAWWPGAEGGRTDAIRIVAHTGAGARPYRPDELFAD